MATRKKKTEKVKEETPVTWPQITKGSHLTVIKYEDGKTDLIWDDEALLKEVQEATKGK